MNDDIKTVIEFNKNLLKNYAIKTKDDSLLDAIASTEGNIVRDGFRTMQWFESKHNRYTENLKYDLGAAVTVKHTDWVEDGPTENRGTDIEINLAEPGLRQRLEAIISADRGEVNQNTFSSQILFERNNAKNTNNIDIKK